MACLKITSWGFVGGIEINAWSQINACITTPTTCMSQTLPRANNSVRDLVQKQTTEVHRCYDVSFKLGGVEVAEKKAKHQLLDNFKSIKKTILHSCWGKVRNKRPSQIHTMIVPDFAFCEHNAFTPLKYINKAGLPGISLSEQKFHKMNFKAWKENRRFVYFLRLAYVI